MSIFPLVILGTLKIYLVYKCKGMNISTHEDFPSKIYLVYKCKGMNINGQTLTKNQGVNHYL